MRVGRVKRLLIKMPDTSHQRQRVDEFERNAPTAGGSKGGVFPARNKKSYIVNIRPRRWSDRNKHSQFWKGKIRNREKAKFFADTIFHYCGRLRCHFGNAPFTFPLLEFMGTEVGAPVRPETPEQLSRYVQAIAGNGFHLQRKDFLQQLMNLIENPDFIKQAERFLNLRNMQNSVEVAPDSSPADEAAADNSSPSEEAAADSSPPTDEAAADNSFPIDEAEECETPLEEDLEAVAMVTGFAASSQVATVPGFGLNMGMFDADRPSGKILESVEQRLGLECFSLYDCPSGEDKGWYMTLEELDKKSAMAAGASAAVVSTSNAGEPIPRPVFANISFIPETDFVVKTTSLEQSCELNHPSVMSPADMALNVDKHFASILTAESEAQLKSAKRQKIQE